MYEIDYETNGSTAGVFYEVELELDGRTREVIVFANGRIRDGDDDDHDGHDGDDHD